MITRRYPTLLGFLLLGLTQLHGGSPQSTGRGQGALLPPPPVLDPHETVTVMSHVTIRGWARGATRVEVVGPQGIEQVPVDQGRFTADITLAQDHVNRLFFTSLNAHGRRSAVRATAITLDLEEPKVFIDYPRPGRVSSTGTVDVSGRVADRLTGHLGLKVTVNGVMAEVSQGFGTNGTFFAKDVPLAGGTAPISSIMQLTAEAQDYLGNRSSATTAVRAQSFLPVIVMVSGGGQTAPVHRQLTKPIVAQVLHQGHTPFANKLVTFRVTKNDGLLTSTPTGTGAPMLQVFTDANGEARAYWAMGGSAGSGNNAVEATSVDIGGRAVFLASATPGSSTQINVSAGNFQRVQAGGPAPEPLRVWVSDTCNPIADVPVTFSVLSGSGTVDGQMQVVVLTDASGYAEVAFTLGPEAGNQTVEATFDGNAGPPARFAIYSVELTPDPTSFTGVVLDNANQPIRNATCQLDVGATTLTTASDMQGLFAFPAIAESGPGSLFVDGRTADWVGGSGGHSVPPGTFPALHYEPLIIPNSANALGMPVLLPPLDPTNEHQYDTTRDVVLTCAGMEGVRMIVKAGTTVTLPTGAVASPSNPVTLSLNQVHFDDVPMPMNNGAAPAFSWTVQPGGTTFEPPLPIIYPNMTGLPVGAVSNFLSFDHDLGQFVIVGTGRVSADGSTIVSDPGVGIGKAGWGCNCPPYSICGDVTNCGASLLIDSDNNGSIDFLDDVIEDFLPGKLVAVNNDDDNQNGLADWNDPGPVVGEDDLAPMLLHSICANPGSKWVVLFDESQISLFANSDRTGPVMSGIPNDYPCPLMLWVEGVIPSSAAGDLKISLEIAGTGRSDAVTLTVIKAEFQADPLQYYGYDDYSSGTPQLGLSQDYLSLKRSSATETASTTCLLSLTPGGAAPYLFLSSAETIVSPTTPSGANTLLTVYAPVFSDKHRSSSIEVRAISSAGPQLGRPLSVEMYKEKLVPTVTYYRVHDSTSSGTNPPADVNPGLGIIKSYVASIWKQTVLALGDVVGDQDKDWPFDKNKNASLDYYFTGSNDEWVELNKLPGDERVMFVRDFRASYRLAADAPMGQFYTVMELTPQLLTLTAGHQVYVGDEYGAGDTYILNSPPVVGDLVLFTQPLKRDYHKVTDFLVATGIKGLASDPIIVTSTTTGLLLKTITHELLHHPSVADLSDLSDQAQDNIMYAFGAGDSTGILLRYREVDRQYEPGTDQQWNKITR